MSIISEKSDYLIGGLYLNDEYLGSCIPFLSNKNFYIITCGHVIYGDNFDKSTKPTDRIEIITTKYKYKCLSILTDIDFAKKNDISIITIDKSSTDFDINNFIELNICSEINNEILNYEHGLVLHPVKDETTSTIKLSNFNKDLEDISYQVDVDKSIFHNLYNGTYGAKEFKGVSGSGLFVSHNNMIFIAGILSSIPKNKLTCPLILQKPDSISSILSDIGVFNFSQIRDLSYIKSQSLLPLPKNVFFIDYTIKSKDYYKERSCDLEFSDNLSFDQNTWIYGRSGTGKTALLKRNLINLNCDYIYCDLSPVSIISKDNLWQGIVEDIGSYLDVQYDENDLTVKSLYNFLSKCKLTNNTVIAIDEMSCNDPTIIREFCNEIINLVRYYSKKEPDKVVIFVISSIFSPKNQNFDKGKVLESFEFVCSDNWESSIGDLFDIQNKALNIGICSLGKQEIISICDNVPRLLTLLMKKINQKQCNEISSIKTVIEKVMADYV
ncbi:AAA family ATPase [Photobacterium carnosum]|uniref:ATP-binding protein n=1 Tax=Photobacterium carnosum TaxID=2023717 RepID=UPI001E4F0486|nr:ATP-binding protein [Photobacterium carnosum]MCD9548769.1 AAA family ATPase [Photobacterium carnosum]MCF2304896.1 AAA family ATPase [Photobacterium carnosum]